MGQTVMEKMSAIGADKRIADFIVKQQQDYQFKIAYAELRAREFAEECHKRGLNYHVSVGGLDSITLFLFLHSIGIYCPAISVSYLEDLSIQKVHKALGVERLRSSAREDGTHWTMQNVIQEFGFPVLSKEIAGKIDILQNPTESNSTVRHAIITGETGEYGGNRKNSRMKMSQRWLDLFAGFENDNENVNYQIAPFKVSDKCCYYLKEKPCADWAKEHNSVPFLGLMASEGGRRKKSLMLNGCNYFGKSTIRSAPFAIFNRDDLLRLTLEMEKYYQEHWKDFQKNNEPLSTIVPEIYGTIEEKEDGTLFTTKAQRTGCSICGFGIHMEQRPNRFDYLWQRNEKAWKHNMFHLAVDTDGQEYGWARVLDYIGVGWQFPDTQFIIQEQKFRRKCS